MPDIIAASIAHLDSNGNKVSTGAANPLPVTASLTPPSGGQTFTTASVQTVTAGGTSQAVFAANTSRVYLLIVNNSDTIMYVEFGADATTASIPLAANGGFYEPLIAPGQTVNLLCATTGKAFVAKQA